MGVLDDDRRRDAEWMEGAGHDARLVAAGVIWLLAIVVLGLVGFAVWVLA